MRTSRERKAGQQTLDSRAAFRAQEDNETTVLRETGATGLEPATSGGQKFWLLGSIALLCGYEFQTARSRRAA